MALIRRGPDEPTPPVTTDSNPSIAALQVGSTQERWRAARSLATVPGAVPALSRALGAERDERVREAIFTSLARINSEGSLEAVLPHLRSDDANLRTGALDALKAMPEAARARLKTLLHDPDPDVRILACDLAREGTTAEVMRLLANLLEFDPEVNVCAAAVDVLAETGSPETLISLARCAERFSDQPFLGFAVKVAVARIGPRSGPRE